MTGQVDIYSTTYSNFTSDVRARIRQEVFGEDIGQHSWTTAAEQLSFAGKSGLTAASRLLEIGCGAGGPAIFLARSLGLSVTGIDINPAGIATAEAAAASAGISDKVKFLCADGGGALPFAGGTFDAIHLIDAINHLPERPALLAEFHRLLRPGGSLLYTDSVVITGAISSEEIAARSSIGFFLFLPDGENEKMLRGAGFTLLEKQNVTASMIAISANWITSRERWRDELIASEGLEPFGYAQDFSRAVHDISSSGKLSRFLYLARKS